ncbi:Bifunctional solanapyrone synthase [Talaromyces pinophilus]|nr:Bifunctional solanapyrone synthase [Talaromyces pinophilus]
MAQVWGGVVALPSNIAREFMSAMSEFQTTGQLDTKDAILPYIAPNNDTILATFVKPVEYPNAFASFYQLSNLSDATQIYQTYYDIALLPVPSAVPRYVTFSID